jgi:aldehyde dehydrogenase (NAD+)
VGKGNILVESSDVFRSGLAAAVHSQDPGQIARVTRKLKAGTVWVNQYSVLHPNVPFGGMKASGWGRELGPQGLDNYLSTKVSAASGSDSNSLLMMSIVTQAVHHYFGPDLQWPFEL